MYTCTFVKLSVCVCQMRSSIISMYKSFLHLEFLNTDNLSGSIDEPVEDGDTALHLTCLYGHLACVQVSHIVSNCPCFNVIVYGIGL